MITNIYIENNKIRNIEDEFLIIKDNNITFLKSGEYNLDIINTTKIDLNIIIKENINVNLFIKSLDNNISINTNYELNQSSKLIVSKFYSNKETKEKVIVNLNGEYSSYTSYFSSICTHFDKYHFIINHNNKNTTSHVSNKSIGCHNSKIDFLIDEYLEKGNTNCNMDQTTKILTLGEVEAKINPNMFIDEDSTIARHGSVISTFSKDDIFYLMSRGIEENEAIDLLLKGFIFSNLNLNMDNRAIIYECIKNIRR